MRSTNLAMIILLKLLLVPCQAKVTDLHCPVIVKQYVLRLQVTVMYLLLVQVLQCHRNLLGHLDDPVIVKNILFLVK